MDEDIREESGIMLIKRQGYHLLNLEKLIETHPNRNCRTLNTPELLQWDEDKLYVLEAKSTIPNRNKATAGEALEKLVNELAELLQVNEMPCSEPKERVDKLVKLVKSEKDWFNQKKIRFLSRFDVYAWELYDKYISALLCLGEDGKQTILKESQAEYIDDATAVKKLHLGSKKKILLLLLIPEMPEEQQAPMTEALSQIFMKKIKAIHPRCEFRAINKKMAIDMKLARA